MTKDLTCHICLANSGKNRISPGATIHDGTYWKVEHAYPTSLLGWIVIVLQRHSEELHNLELAEWQELATIQFHLLSVMKDILPSSREYVSCFAEKEGFKHIHFHLIPKTTAFSEDYSGSKAFKYINPDPSDVVPLTDVASLCDALHRSINGALSGGPIFDSSGPLDKGLP